MKEYSLSIKALDIAIKAHEGQVRWDGAPYITHPVSIASRFKDDRHKATALLHDVIEDTKVTAQDLRDAGMPEDIINAVLMVTRKEGENYFDFICRIAGYDSNEDRLPDWQIMAMRVKVADLNDNMESLKEGAMKDKYRFAHHILTMAIDSESVPGEIHEDI